MIQTFTSQLRLQGDLTIVDLSGEINAFADQELNAIYDQAEASEAATIALNFSSVGYINSTGIALLVGLLARAMKTHRKMVAYGLTDHYLEIFQITRLADFIKIYPDEASILAEASAKSE
jgi:anti-sigma B factor antagonist